MRITGHRMLELAATAASRAQSSVAETSQQLSSGKRVATPSDDPLAWAQARRADARATIDRGRGEAVASGRDQLRETEQSLAAIGEALSEAREVAVAASNGGLNAVDRTALGQRARGLFATALAAANARTSSGDYLLAGSRAATMPFDSAGQYLGDSASRSIELSEGGIGAITIAGDMLTTSSGLDVLPAMDRLATALAANDLPSIQLSIEELTRGHQQALEARRSVGVMARALDDSDAARSELAVTLADRIAELSDSDVTLAASDLARGTMTLEASRAVTARLAALLSPSR